MKIEIKIQAEIDETVLNEMISKEDPELSDVDFTNIEEYIEGLKAQIESKDTGAITISNPDEVYYGINIGNAGIMKNPKIVSVSKLRKDGDKMLSGGLNRESYIFTLEEFNKISSITGYIDREIDDIFVDIKREMVILTVR